MTQRNTENRLGRHKAWVAGATLPAFLLASGLALSEARADGEAKGDEYSESRDMTEVVTDGWITTRVKSRLLADREVSGFDISVETRDTIVYLSGEVEDQSQVNHAVKIARDTEGVGAVDATALRVATAVDQMRGALGGERTDGNAESRKMTDVVSDGWITAKVKSRLFADRAVSGFDISVETRDRVVYLSGEVDNESQGNHAMRIVRETEGVESVDATALRIATEVDQVHLAARDPTGDTYRDEYRDLPDPGYPEPRDSTEDVSDDQITAEVQSKLFTDPEVSGYDIAVETHDKVVYLSGEVDDQSQVSKAVQIAHNTRGVERVDATALRVAG